MTYYLRGIVLPSHAARLLEGTPKQTQTGARKRIVRWGAVLGTLVAAITFANGPGGLPPLIEAETVDEQLAERFLIYYYREATENPQQCCWEQLEDGPKELISNRLGRAFTKQDYVDFFERYTHIGVSRVREVSPGKFSARITYEPKGNGGPTTEKATFTLRCGKWWTQLPVLSCRVGNVTIHHVTNPYF